MKAFHSFQMSQRARTCDHHQLGKSRSCRLGFGLRCDLNFACHIRCFFLLSRLYHCNIRYHHNWLFTKFAYHWPFDQTSLFGTGWRRRWLCLSWSSHFEEGSSHLIDPSSCCIDDLTVARANLKKYHQLMAGLDVTNFGLNYIGSFITSRIMLHYSASLPG